MRGVKVAEAGHDRVPKHYFCDSKMGKKYRFTP